MEFRILGPLEVEEDGRSIPLAGAKQRALLALLLLARGRPVSTERLIEEIWDGAPPENALKSVQVYVARLRKLLGDGRLVTHERGYELLVEPGELDADRFDELTRAASGAAPEEAAARLREALALFRGEPLADLQLEPWAQPEIARLEERRLAALEARIDADLALGRHRELVPELEALAAAHPFREHLLEQLMLALYRSGRQADALDAYRRGAARLRTSSGSSPVVRCRSSSSASCARIRLSTHPRRRTRRCATPGLEARCRRCCTRGRGRHGGGRDRDPRKRYRARGGPARRRDRGRVERPSRRADPLERDQVAGGGGHRGRQLLGMDPGRELDGADRSERRAPPRPHQLSVRRRTLAAGSSTGGVSGSAARGWRGWTSRWARRRIVTG